MAAGSATPVAELGETAATRAKASEFVGWLAIAGTALALVGFLLPWSSISVIGADGVGYFDRWGFAGPWHILIVVGLLAVLAAAIMRERVPAWLGIGLPGLGVGALLIGLVWPYLIGPLDGSLGAMATALGLAHAHRRWDRGDRRGPSRPRRTVRLRPFDDQSGPACGAGLWRRPVAPACAGSRMCRRAALPTNDNGRDRPGCALYRHPHRPAGHRSSEGALGDPGGPIERS